MEYNQTILKLYKYKNGEKIKGKSLTELLLKEESVKIKKVILPIVRKKKSWVGEIYGKKQDGTYSLQELFLTVNSEDTYICMIREKDMALGQNVGHHCTLFNNLTDGLFKVNSTGKCISVNQSLLKMLGYDKLYPLASK